MKTLNILLVLGMIAAIFLYIILNEQTEIGSIIVFMGLFGLCALGLAWLASVVYHLIVYKVLKKDKGVSFLTFFYASFIVVILMSFDKKDCSNNQEAYNDGYNLGSVAKSLGDYTGAIRTLDGLNEQGIYPHVANQLDKDCFCIGYAAGFDGDENEYIR